MIQDEELTKDELIIAFEQLRPVGLVKEGYDEEDHEKEELVDELQTIVETAYSSGKDIPDDSKFIYVLTYYESDADPNSYPEPAKLFFREIFGDREYEKIHGEEICSRENSRAILKEEKEPELEKERQEGIDYPEPDNCQGPMVEDCFGCPYLEHCIKNSLNDYLNLKHWVLKYALKELNGAAFKVFIYLSSQANFTVKDNKFARCWKRYDQITEATRITRVDRCIKELVEKELIDHRCSTISTQDGARSINQFTVHWYKIREELLKTARELEKGTEA